MAEIKTEFLFDMKADLDMRGAIRMGTTPHGTRTIVYVTGGYIEGPKIKATVLPGGGDWLLGRSDGSRVMDVRAAVRTDDGQFIYTYYRGYLNIPPEMLQRIYKGEKVDPSEYYFRTTPVFETASEKYAWLNNIVAVGIGTMSATAVAYKVYSIL